MSTSANTLYGLPRAEISVILPVLNEEKYLADSVSAILNQKFDGPIEVILAVGPSNDKTMEIARKLATHDARVVVIENPSGRTAAGLNLATFGVANFHDNLDRIVDTLTRMTQCFGHLFQRESVGVN